MRGSAFQLASTPSGVGAAQVLLSQGWVKECVHAGTIPGDAAGLVAADCSGRCSEGDSLACGADLGGQSRCVKLQAQRGRLRKHTHSYQYEPQMSPRDQRHEAWRHL